MARQQRKPDGDAESDFVKVYTVKNANQAEIVKNFLEREGIFCAIEGEGQVGLAGILDIRLLVRAADAERARQLIKEHERTALEDEGLEDEGLEVEGQEEDE